MHHKGQQTYDSGHEDSESKIKILVPTSCAC